MAQLDNQDPGTLHWGVDLFNYDKRAIEKRERINEMDIAGRARCLVWGPYNKLPKGQWKASVSFSMDHWASRHQFAIELGSTKRYERFELRPAKPGIYEADIDFEVSGDEKVEIRIILNQSSLGGVFEFLGADLTMIEA